MGLKTTNYELKDMGIIIDNAYAQIDSIVSKMSGRTNATFKIQSTREDMDKQSLEYININFEADKTLPLFEQAYNEAKKTVFEGWIDDIVE